MELSNRFLSINTATHKEHEENFQALLGRAKTGVKQVMLSESSSLWTNGYMLRIKMMLEEFSEWGSVFLILSIVNIP